MSARFAVPGMSGYCLPDRWILADTQHVDRGMAVWEFDVNDVAVPGVYSLHRPQVPAVPVVFDSPHSGTVFPADFGSIVPERILRRVQDNFVDDLFYDVLEYGASLLCAHFPRSYIDPNRAQDDLDSRLLSEAWPEPLRPTDKSRLGHGLIWRACPTDRAMYDRRLTAREVRNRIETYWRPYHAVLAEEIDHLWRRFGQVWHVNCHSMPAGSSPIVARRGGSQRADIVIGDRDGRSSDPEFTTFVRDRLEQRGYTVRLNDPYKGAYLIEAYAAPAVGRSSIQMEINRSIYMNEATLEKSGNFEVLRRDLTGLSEEIAGFALDRTMPQAAE